MRGKNLIGQTFSRLTVIEGPIRIRSGEGICLVWRCACTCGAIKDINGSNLRLRKTLSCGCLQKERASAVSITHGMSRSSEYNIWCKMHLRCEDPKVKNYNNYGGRGISVCERWGTFENFIFDMGLRPTRKHSIERLNNNLGYGPTNCIWATAKTQCNNTRVNVNLTFNGETLTLAQWSARIGIKDKTLYARHAAGWTAERILTEPLRGSHADLS